MSLTDSLQQDRHVIVAVDPARKTIRVKGAADACTDLTCSAHGPADLAALTAGDIVKLEGPPAGLRRIVVVRRVWDELSSPEW